MGDLLIAGTDIPRLRKTKLPPLSFNDDRYAPSISVVQVCAIFT